jgi:hypothetical protein
MFTRSRFRRAPVLSRTTGCGTVRDTHEDGGRLPIVIRLASTGLLIVLLTQRIANAQLRLQPYSSGFSTPVNFVQDPTLRAVKGRPGGQLSATPVRG